MSHAPRPLAFPRLIAALALVFVAWGVAQAGQQTSPPPAPHPSEVTVKLDCGAIPSTILSRSINVCVALPADYDNSPSTRYPTLYFLHGLFENERSWAERGGKEILDDLLRQGLVGKFLVVLPDGGRTFYVNSFDGRERYEDFFIQELVPAIDLKYRTLPQAAKRGISGTSMGGYGALHLSMSHANVFGSASAESAALLPKFPNPLPTEGRWGFYARVLQGPFGSPLNESYWEANSPLTLAEHSERFAGLKIYFDCGDHDRYGFQEGAQSLDRILAEKRFPHEFALLPGDHGWSYLKQYMKNVVLFHWRCFEGGQTASPSPNPERRVVEYLRDHTRRGEPLRATELYNQVFTQPEERKALDKLYNAFFRIPLFVARYQEQVGSPPRLRVIAQQFDLESPEAAQVLLRLMEADPRVPRFFERDPKTLEITRVDAQAVRNDQRFSEASQHRLGGWEGRPAPEFTAPRFDGTEFDSRALHGKTILLYVWFTGCPPCVQETPNLVNLDKEFSGRGLVIVGANADRLLGLSVSDEDRRRYAEREKIGFPLVHWARENNAAFGNILSFPTLFLIDPKGVILRHWVGYVDGKDLRQAVTEGLERAKTARLNPSPSSRGADMAP